MGKREREPKTIGERLKHTARLPLVLVLGAGAIALSPSNVDAISDNALPILPKSHDTTEEMLASATFHPNEQPHYQFIENSLPQEYTFAIDKALNIQSS